MKANGRSVLLSCRGCNNEKDAVIFLDGTTRTRLGIREGQTDTFEFLQVWWLGQFLWAWRASDPIYRIAARIGLISLVFSFIGLLLGVIGLIVALCLD